MFGDGHHPRQPGLVEVHRRAASLRAARCRAPRRCANSWLKSRASSPMVMPWRSGIGNCPTNDAHSGPSSGPFDRDAADRIRAIADDDAHAVPGGGAHAVRHRVDVGVDARADVLQIDHQHVDVAQHLRRSARGSRCRANRSACAAARRGRAASRSCCPADRIGTRAADRTARPGRSPGSSARTSAAWRKSRVDRRRVRDQGDAAAGERAHGRRRAAVRCRPGRCGWRGRSGTCDGLYAPLR